MCSIVNIDEKYYAFKPKNFNFKFAFVQILQCQHVYITMNF